MDLTPAAALTSRCLRGADKAWSDEIVLHLNALQKNFKFVRQKVLKGRDLQIPVGCALGISQPAKLKAAKEGHFYPGPHYLVFATRCISGRNTSSPCTHCT
jgi:hypothetical protein